MKTLGTAMAVILITCSGMWACGGQPPAEQVISTDKTSLRTARAPAPCETVTIHGVFYDDWGCWPNEAPECPTGMISSGVGNRQPASGPEGTPCKYDLYCCRIEQ